MSVIEYTIKPKPTSSLPLTQDDIINLYSTIGLFSSSKNVNDQLRLKTLETVYQTLYQRLTINDLDIIYWSLKFLNTFSKGL